MRIYAVIDTNVIVSSMISHNSESPTIEIMKCIFSGRIVPLYSAYLIDEYRRVLERPKFGLSIERIQSTIRSIMYLGIHIEPTESGVILPDKKDLPIYEITLDTQDVGSYLVTGNVKHFPQMPFVVTPREMLEIMSQLYSGNNI